MKLKFTTNIDNLINTLCQFPDTTELSTDLNKFIRVISNYTDELRKHEIKDKIWVKTRREASFLYSFIYSIHEKDKDPIKQYSLIVKAVKEIQSEEILKDIPFIRLAMSYGVVRLSDNEIHHLIRYNTPSVPVE